MDKLGFILLCFAFVCFVIAAFWAEPHRPKLVAAGLACMTAAFIFGSIPALVK